MEGNEKKERTTDISADFREYLWSLSEHDDPGEGNPEDVSLPKLADLFGASVVTLKKALIEPISTFKAQQIRGFIYAARYAHWPELPRRLAGALFKLEALTEEPKLLALDALGTALEAVSGLIPIGSFDSALVLNVRGWIALDAGGIYEGQAQEWKKIRNMEEAETPGGKSTKAYERAESLFARAHDALERHRDKLPQKYTSAHLDNDLQKIKINELGAVFNQYPDGTRISSEPLLSTLRESKHLEALQTLSERESNRGSWSVHYQGLVTASVIGQYLCNTGDERWKITVPQLEDLCKAFYSRLTRATTVDRSVPLPGCVYSVDDDPDLPFFRRIDPSASAAGS
ncbi:hypothetical protein QTI66_31995 [Variovorax sp. J22R133]|uniref:hypothetical protein n=1 Tax=Variovorax brevis TaxID=3053503 RepID=UPI002575A634|nr:hypothetical protein [Variovorax sp. J22R133]MDM0116759.1 hypothetical protein [Variovorax sp. J22R133]